MTSLYFVERTGDSSLCHHGILGQKWGVRRFQNKDGTLTAEGRRRQKAGSDSTEKGSSEPASTGRKMTSTEFASELKKDEGASAYLKIADSKEFTDLALAKAREQAKLYDKYYGDCVESDRISDKYDEMANKELSNGNWEQWVQLHEEGRRKAKAKLSPYHNAESKLDKADKEKQFAMACKILNVEDTPENRGLIDKYMLFDQQDAYDKGYDLYRKLEMEIINKYQKSR